MGLFFNVLQVKKSEKKQKRIGRRVSLLHARCLPFLTSTLVASAGNQHYDRVVPLPSTFLFHVCIDYGLNEERNWGYLCNGISWINYAMEGGSWTFYMCHIKSKTVWRLCNAKHWCRWRVATVLFCIMKWLMGFTSAFLKVKYLGIAFGSI